jgi:phage terminase large subunit-like protein
MFAAGMVWAPDKAWAQMVIDETCTFPKSRYADLVDTTSQALSYLRRNDLLLLAHEADEETVRRNSFQSQRPAPYDV